MGRIKTQQTKRLTRMLMASSDKFTTDFTHNKTVVNDIAQVQSKKIRNIVAGYASRLVKGQQKHAV
ncbi:MAG: 30S ribosomal protein S17e [Candidatus Woesearchaeota archaeon]